MSRDMRKACRKYSRAKRKAERKVDHGQETATLSSAGRNWDARNGKFEIGFEGYKERNPGGGIRGARTLEP